MLAFIYQNLIFFIVIAIISVFIGFSLRAAIKMKAVGKKQLNEIFKVIYIVFWGSAIGASLIALFTPDSLRGENELFLFIGFAFGIDCLIMVWKRLPKTILGMLRLMFVPVVLTIVHAYLTSWDFIWSSIFVGGLSAGVSFIIAWTYQSFFRRNKVITEDADVVNEAGMIYQFYFFLFLYSAYAVYNCVFHFNEIYSQFNSTVGLQYTNTFSLVVFVALSAYAIYYQTRSYILILRGVFEEDESLF